jgi:hypothetical protein
VTLVGMLCALLTACASQAVADARIQPLTSQTLLSVHNRAVAVSLKIHGRYRLALARAGAPAVVIPGLASRSVAFDVDLGIDSGGGLVATYSRCTREHRDLDPDFSVVPYDHSQGCRPFQYSFARRRESRLPSLPGASIYLPSRWRDNLVFATHRDGGPAAARRRQSIAFMNLRSRHVRYLRGGRPALANSQGLAMAAPRVIDLHGTTLAFTWQADVAGCPDDNGLSDDAVSTELWSGSLTSTNRRLASACTRTNASYAIRGVQVTDLGVVYAETSITDSNQTITVIRSVRGHVRHDLVQTTHFPTSLGVSGSQIVLAAGDDPPGMYDLPRPAGR